MKIIRYNPKYDQEIYEFVMAIKAGEIGWKSDAWELRDIPKYYTDSGGEFWLAIENDQIVGTIALEQIGEKYGYLKRMYLAGQYRGTGLARQMLKLLVDYAKTRKMQEIYLATTRNTITERAIAFYSKEGFEHVPNLPDGFRDEDCDVHMKLTI